MEIVALAVGAFVGTIVGRFVFEAARAIWRRRNSKRERFTVELKGTTMEGKHDVHLTDTVTGKSWNLTGFGDPVDHVKRFTKQIRKTEKIR